MGAQRTRGPRGACTIRHLLQSTLGHHRPHISRRRRVSSSVIDVKDFEGRRTPVAHATSTTS